MTSDELWSLNKAIEFWLLDFNTLFYPGVAVFDKSLTLSFLTRYMHSSGDQTLGYSVVSDERKIKESNEWVIGQVQSGNLSPSAYPIQGYEWNNGDLRTSIGGCLVHYKVVPMVGKYEVICTIDDPYDFHSKLTANFPYLDYEGWIFGWNGGEDAYDTWMKQHADNGYAKVFNTRIIWKLAVE